MRLRRLNTFMASGTRGAVMFRNDFLFMNIFMNFHEWGLTNFRFYVIMKPEKRRKDFGMSDYTIKDIARMAGVSTGTVSRVLNGADNIAPDLYARTMEVLRSTNYLESKRRVVAAGTESKVRRMMKRICVVTPDMTAAWSGHQLWNEYLPLWGGGGGGGAAGAGAGWDAAVPIPPIRRSISSWLSFPPPELSAAGASGGWIRVVQSGDDLSADCD